MTTVVLVPGVGFVVETNDTQQLVHLIPGGYVQFDAGGFTLLSVDSDNAVFSGQTGIIILPGGGALFAAAGNRVTIDQGGVRINQTVTAESISSITITANLTGLSLPGTAALHVHRPR